jgi:hypothetical protein
MTEYENEDACGFNRYNALAKKRAIWRMLSWAEEILQARDDVASTWLIIQLCNGSNKLKRSD